MASTSIDLGELFGWPASAESAVAKRFRALCRKGKLLLALPLCGPEAAVALDLYAPQKLAARVTLGALRLALRGGVPVPLPNIEQRCDRDDPFCRFLSQLAPTWAARDRGLAVLAGNPREAGRRFVLMLLKDGRATAVVKAGVGAEAQRLITREAAFLRAAQRPGIAPPLAVLEGGRVCAFAMQPLAGASPRHASAADLSRALLPWLEDSRRVPLRALAGWARTAAICAERPEWREHCAPIADRAVCPSLAHGDFAPWNIKVHPTDRVWQVFDWERGEADGVPGWDWLHFEIQTAILVRGETAPAVRTRVGRLMAAPEFRSYAQRAGLAGIERGLLVAYLLHAAAVQPAAEGSATLADLIQLVSAQ